MTREKTGREKTKPPIRALYFCEMILNPQSSAVQGHINPPYCRPFLTPLGLGLGRTNHHRISRRRNSQIRPSSKIRIPNFHGVHDADGCRRKTVVVVPSRLRARADSADPTP